MSRKSILLVDDDRELLARLTDALRGSGFDVVTAMTGPGALRCFREAPADLVVLDIALAAEDSNTEMDGLQVLEALRQMAAVPVMMLSSTAIPTVKVLALDAGADDYLTKPFDTKEFVARIRALLRRLSPGNASGNHRKLGELEIAPDERRVWKRGVEIHLTAREFDLLQVMSARPGRVFSRDALFDLAWSGSFVGVAKGIDVHIGNLRKKLGEGPGEHAYIATVRGVGYRFELPEAE